MESSKSVVIGLRAICQSGTEMKVDDKEITNPVKMVENNKVAEIHNVIGGNV